MAVFVRARNADAPPGFGKVIGVHGTRATVEYFNSPTEAPILHTLETSALDRKEISAQTRAYWQDGRTGIWRVGRIIDGEGERIAIRFPNGDERALPASEVCVRWDAPITDPTPYLAQLICETPLLADARSGFVSALTAQRGASFGMSSLLSSAIELETHQIEVMRRVLQDPIQRYLLADEVGLGKTIEAGVLIRQYAIDDPEHHRVVVVAPPALVAQWCEELKRKFFLSSNASDARIHVLSTTDAARCADLISGAGMLVVDEAHHLSGDPELYDAILKASKTTPRLLLLSATPVLRNEKGFLEMLHLLDPAVYPLNGLDSFRRKIEHRQSIAESAAALVPENLLQLDLFLDNLAGQFSDDTELMQRISALRAVLEGFPPEDDPDLLHALNAVRGHLSEVYRLDRRILRNRRAAVTGLTPERDGATLITHNSQPRAAFVEALEQWRSEAAVAIYGQDDSDSARSLATWCVSVVEAALSLDEQAMKRLLAAPPEHAPPTAALDAATAELFQDHARDDALLQALGGILKNEKCVLFCTTKASAVRVGAQLGGNLGNAVALAHGPGRAAALQRFVEQADCRLLVCDRTDEEGLNLQGGEKAVIHYDLPLAPNRIEQRIGRLDRYGSGESIHSYILSCQDDPYEQAWASCLLKGLGLFDRSIASLQYLVDAEMKRLLPKLLVEGHWALDEATRRLGGDAGEIARELHRIEQQDALDALDKPVEDGLDTLFAVDQAWGSFQAKVDDWMVRCLQMANLPGPTMGPLPPGDRVSRFALTRDGPHPTLIPLDRFVETMLPTLDKDAPGASYRRPTTYPYTCRRQTALSRRGRAAGVRLLRYGDALLDGLQAITSLDDRGRCFAVWRQLTGYAPEQVADPFIRFDFVVEVNTDGPAAIYSEAFLHTARTAAAALRRRGDMLFPPFFHRLWLDRDLKSVEDANLLTRLEAPYQKRPVVGYADTNLNPTRVDSLRAMGSPLIEGWREFIPRARSVAETLVFEREEITRRASEAIARARALDAASFASLKMRIARAEGPAAEADGARLKTEEAAAEALCEGIAHPRVTLDTVGVVLLSNISFADYARSPLAVEDA